MDLLSVIVKPLHSEKSYGLRNNEVKKYVFEVATDANKYQISLAFQLIYGIVPSKINVINRKPVPTRTGTRKPGMTKLKKIAYITLPPGVDIKMDDSETPTDDTSKKETKSETKETKLKDKLKKGVLSKLTKKDKKEE